MCLIKIVYEHEIHCKVYSVVAVLLVHYLISLYHNNDNVAEKTLVGSQHQTMLCVNLCMCTCLSWAEILIAILTRCIYYFPGTSAVTIDNFKQEL